MSAEETLEDRMQRVSDTGLFLNNALAYLYCCCDEAKGARDNLRELGNLESSRKMEALRLRAGELRNDFEALNNEVLPSLRTRREGLYREIERRKTSNERVDEA